MSEAAGPPPETAGTVGDPRQTPEAYESQEDPVVEGTLGSLLFVLALWLVILYAVVEAFEFRPAARTLPHIAGFPSLLVATILVGREAARWRRRRQGVVPTEPRDVRAEVEACGWFLAYGAGVLLIGFAPASAVFMVAFLRLYGRERWSTVLLLTAGVLGVFVGIFNGVLNIGVYGGWLPTMLSG